MPDRLDQLTAAILVGGLGTRLRPVLADRQKVVAPVAGRPFLFRLLDQLADAGLRRVVLCTGHKAEQVVESVGKEYRSMQISYSAEPVPLGTAGALRHALPLFGSDPVLTMNGDSSCEVDLTALWEAHRQHQATGTLVVAHVADSGGRGCVRFDADGAITSFAEKVAAGEGWINAGIYLLGRSLLESIPPERAVSIERETFPSWVGRGLYAFQTRGRFLDIGTPESYVIAQQFFA